MSEKKVYAIGRISKGEVQTTFYKFFEYRSDAEEELKKIAELCKKAGVKWNKYGGFHVLGDYWEIKELSLH